MAVVVSPIEALAEELERIALENGVELSANAKYLLELSSRAWHNDFRFKDDRDPEKDFGPMQEVVYAAMHDEAVQEQQQKAGRVDYFTLFAALGRHGRRIFKEIFNKGFQQ